MGGGGAGVGEGDGRILSPSLDDPIVQVPAAQLTQVCVGLSAQQMLNPRKRNNCSLIQRPLQLPRPILGCCSSHFDDVALVRRNGYNKVVNPLNSVRLWGGF